MKDNKQNLLTVSRSPNLGSRCAQTDMVPFGAPDLYGFDTRPTARISLVEIQRRLATLPRGFRMPESRRGRGRFRRASMLRRRRRGGLWEAPRRRGSSGSQRTRALARVVQSPAREVKIRTVAVEAGRPCQHGVVWVVLISRSAGWCVCERAQVARGRGSNDISHNPAPFLSSFSFLLRGPAQLLC